MRSIFSVNPFRCRVWALHDRIDTHISEESCRDEIESFSKHGQLVPVLGRTLRGDLNHDIEIIFGARRLFVAQHINKPLLVEVRELSDVEALVAMDIENRQRKDISPYERGMSYARWLRSGFFKSQDDIARALKISSSQVSRLLKFARLPSVVVSAFENPAEICEGWGLSLIEALDDPRRRQATLQRARAIGAAGQRSTAADVYHALLRAPVQGRKIKVSTRDEVVKTSDDVPLFRIQYRRGAIALLLPMEMVSAECLDVIRTSVANALTRDRAQHSNEERTTTEVSGRPHLGGSTFGNAVMYERLT